MIKSHTGTKTGTCNLRRTLRGVWTETVLYQTRVETRTWTGTGTVLY